MLDFQEINLIKGAKSLTTKIGLYLNFKKLPYILQKDPNEFFPESFLLTQFSTDINNFLRAFLMQQIIINLQSFINVFEQVESPSSFNSAKFQLLLVSLEYLEGLLEMEGQLPALTYNSQNFLKNHPVPRIFTQVKVSKKDFLASEKEDEELRRFYLKAQEITRRIKQKCPQQHISFVKNTWIMKPVGLSRGRGIQVFNRLEDIQNYMKNNDIKYII